MFDRIMLGHGVDGRLPLALAKHCTIFKKQHPPNVAFNLGTSG